MVITGSWHLAALARRFVLDKAQKNGRFKAKAIGSLFLFHEDFEINDSRRRDEITLCV